MPGKHIITRRQPHATSHSGPYPSPVPVPVPLFPPCLQGFIDGAVRAGQRAAVLVLSHNWHHLFDAGIDQLQSPIRWTPPSSHAFPGLRATAWRLRNKAFHRPQQALLCLLIALWILYRLLC